jgi:cell wall-associated NlpC family hydrolase
MKHLQPLSAVQFRKSTLIAVLAVAMTAFAMLGLSTADRAQACAATSSGGLNLSKGKCKRFAKARLVNGKAIAPASAPLRVKRVINWANRIRNKPYIYGGGHSSFNSRGYDCSGAVSYALRGGGFVSSPMASTGYMNWRNRGRGKWITVYSNPGHAYMVVAGLRFDTSMTPGDGPGWSRSMRSTPGSFSARHPAPF